MDSGLRKRMLVVAAGAGGAVIAVAIVAALGVWYLLRPKAPKPPATIRILSAEAANIGSSVDGKSVRFSFNVQNTRDSDIQVSGSQFTVQYRLKDGSLSPTLHPEVLPIFIPSGQKGFMIVNEEDPEIPPRSTTESDTQYDERVRTWWQQNTGGRISGLVLFDEINRYEIDVPFAGSSSAGR